MRYTQCAFHTSRVKTNFVLVVFQINIQKLVNAKYCDRFPVVRWKDGKVVHVQVTPELHRNYEQKMITALRCIQQRSVDNYDSTLLHRSSKATILAFKIFIIFLSIS